MESISKGMQEVLDEVGIDREELEGINGTSVHPIVSDIRAYTDQRFLVFIHIPHDRQRKFLYYIGAEREARLICRFREVTVWGNIEKNILAYFAYKSKRK